MDCHLISNQLIVLCISLFTKLILLNETCKEYTTNRGPLFGHWCCTDRIVLWPRGQNLSIRGLWSDVEL